MKIPKPILDYSSPAQEQTQDQKLEDERLKAIEAYNESTFGERRPMSSSLLRLGALVALTYLLVLYLPRGIGWALAGLTFVGFFAWEIRIQGWRVPRSSIHRPFRWW